ncbi:hypothetical protein B0H66DRAFT_533415 [Apodospora peruviana]|uniref:Uncharacterized protein n=1 Tax=Apodospora peruviana TaxID=516989 RepID=A0AAE0I5E4_9PEZI|nr:hypothetical protein B0H66DRAFT_533415 [Apodospora peruviana]
MWLFAPNTDNPAAGVSALPLLLTQCNAAISLTDDEYSERVWCSVEVMMAHTLARYYSLHLWYEHVYDDADNNENNEVGWLREGPLDLQINIAERQLSFERDQPKVLFLESQSRLLA